MVLCSHQWRTSALDGGKILLQNATLRRQRHSRTILRRRKPNPVRPNRELARPASERRDRSSHHYRSLPLWRLQFYTVWTTDWRGRPSLGEDANKTRPLHWRTTPRLTNR